MAPSKTTAKRARKYNRDEPGNWRITSFRIDNGIWTRFRDQADKDGRSGSSIICDLIVGYLEGAYKLPTRVETVERVYPKQ